MRVRLRLDGREHDVHLEGEGDTWMADVDGTRIEIQLRPDADGATARSGNDRVHASYRQGRLTLEGHDAPLQILALEGVAGASSAAGGDGAIRPPMTGKLVRIAVKEGDDVEEGQVLFVLEAMKMQNEVRSPLTGRVAELGARPGEAVETDRVVVRIEA